MPSSRILLGVCFPLGGQMVGQTPTPDLGPVSFISQSLTPKAPAHCSVSLPVPLSPLASTSPFVFLNLVL